jgi:large subunit ribosomal protein L20
MTRVKRGVTTQKRHKKILELAKGYRTIRHSQYRLAKQAVMKAMQYAYRDRRTKKREIRQLWIVRINAAVVALGGKYSLFIKDLKTADVQIDRKILAKLAAERPESFAAVFSSVTKQ